MLLEETTKSITEFYVNLYLKVRETEQEHLYFISWMQRELQRGIPQLQKGDESPISKTFINTLIPMVRNLKETVLNKHPKLEGEWEFLQKLMNKFIFEEENSDLKQDTGIELNAEKAN